MYVSLQKFSPIESCHQLQLNEQRKTFKEFPHFFAFIHQTVKANFSKPPRMKDCRGWFQTENVALFILLST